MKLNLLAALTAAAIFSAGAAELPADFGIVVDGAAVDGASFTRTAPDSDKYTVDIELKKGKHQVVFGSKSGKVGSSGAEFSFGEPVALKAGSDAPLELNIFLPGTYTFTFNNRNADAPTVSVLRATKKSEFKRPLPVVDCESWDGGPVEVDVSSSWKDGTVVRDAYTGAEAEVKNGKVTMQPSPDSEGILMLEAKGDENKARPFDWDNAIVYFIMTDRFYNGNPSNDNSFGRHKDGKDEIGTWHGGDFKGITEKLDYIKSLGVNAIWITPIVEQTHGFIGGGDVNNPDPNSGSTPEAKTWPFYGYHGYWASDFTKLDPNLGTEDEFREMIDEAHKRGIRILVDTVMNHPGHISLADIQDYGLKGLVTEQVQKSLPEKWIDWKPSGLYGSWQSVSGNIDWQSEGWKSWWGGDWVRAGFPGYPAGGTDDQTMQVGGLPDFLTESQKKVDLPEFLKNKKDTRAKPLKDATVVDYLVSWQSDWVRRFGVDGFRCDTVKHIEPEAWAKLKDASSKAFEEWKKNNPDKVLDDNKFFTVGEIWDSGVTNPKDVWYAKGHFDSLINFDYAKNDALNGALCMSSAEGTYESFAKNVAAVPGFNVLSYISSHDVKLFWGDYKNIALQKRVANSFLMLPGQVQIYYGDESGRGLMKDGGYPDQALRSDMNWKEIESGPKSNLVKHWSRVLNFRNRHPAIAEGTHRQLSQKPYAFERAKGDDKVVIVFAGNRPDAK